MPDYREAVETFEGPVIDVDLSSEMDEKEILDPVSMGLPHSSWRPNQLDAIKFINQTNHEHIFLELPTGCVSGDTVVMVNRAKNGRRVTIREAFLKENSTWRKDVPSKTRSYFPDGRIGLNLVTRFAYSGKRDTYYLSLENDMCLRATRDHPVLTDHGYVALDSLSVGDKVLCDTMSHSVGKKPRYKLIGGLAHHPYSDKVKSSHFKGQISNRVPYHRLVVEANSNGISVIDLISRCQSGDVETLKFLDPQVFAVHHIDGNVGNNDASNLKVLLHLEHKQLHAKDAYNNFGHPTYSAVRNINYYGVEDTFDIVCEGEPHNFVANGIVVHNSGKSGIATALGKYSQVLVLVNSLALLDQYEEKYGFTIVKGMANYDCVLPKRVQEFQAKKGRAPSVGECALEKMSSCPVADKCPYLVARERAFKAKRMACTYPFAMLSINASMRKGVAIWDEGHASAESFLSFSELRFSERFRSDYNLPPLPLFGYEDHLSRPNRLQVLKWLDKAILELQPKGLMDDDDKAKLRSAQSKVQFAKQMLDDYSMEYYYTCQRNLEQESVKQYGKWITRPAPGMMIKPLSPSWIAKKVRNNKDKTIVMSATIGDPDPLARELGMDDYASKTYPHPIPISARPVFNMKLERMTYDVLTQRPIVYRLQAIEIANLIKRYPEQWRTVIMCASYDKTNKLKEFLRLIPTVGNRLFVPKDGGINARIAEFLKDPRPGLIVVDTVQGWGHGVDLYGDLARIAIVASVPFGNLTDPFEQVRRKFTVGGSKYAWWFSYMHVPQACGRVSRGELDDNGDPVLNIAALADGSAVSPQALKYYPKWFSEALIPWEK